MLPWLPILAIDPQLGGAPAKRSTTYYLWAVLITRIYEVFPLLCPLCGGQMRLIAFITEGTQIRKILDHIGVDSEPLHISPARGPPLWDDFDGSWKCTEPSSFLTKVCSKSAPSANCT
jgi:hypothetical protein